MDEEAGAGGSTGKGGEGEEKEGWEGEHRERQLKVKVQGLGGDGCSAWWRTSWQGTVITGVLTKYFDAHTCWSAFYFTGEGRNCLIVSWTPQRIWVPVSLTTVHNRTHTKLSGRRARLGHRSCVRCEFLFEPGRGSLSRGRSKCCSTGGCGFWSRKSWKFVPTPCLPREGGLSCGSRSMPASWTTLFLAYYFTEEGR